MELLVKLIVSFFAGVGAGLDRIVSLCCFHPDMGKDRRPVCQPGAAQDLEPRHGHRSGGAWDRGDIFFTSDLMAAGSS